MKYLDSKKTSSPIIKALLEGITKGVELTTNQWADRLNIPPGKMRSLLTRLRRRKVFIYPVEIGSHGGILVNVMEQAKYVVPTAQRLNDNFVLTNIAALYRYVEDAAMLYPAQFDMLSEELDKLQLAVIAKRRVINNQKKENTKEEEKT